MGYYNDRAEKPWERTCDRLLAAGMLAFLFLAIL